MLDVPAGWCTGRNIAVEVRSPIEMKDTPPGRARPGEIHSDPIRQQRALPDRRNECTPGHGRYVHVRYERGGIGAVRRRDGRPAGGPVRAVHSAVVVPYSSWSTSMARSTRDRATAVCRRRRRTRTHYYIMVETKPMGAPAGTCSACMRVRVHWRTAARSRTYSAVGVSWRASERRSLSSRSFIVKHLLVRVICAKSPIPRTLPSRPIPRCHHTQPPLHAYAIIGGAGPC